MTQIEITFLGTTAGIPTKVRNHPSIYLKYKSENEFSYLFDCGEGTQRQILFSGLNFMRINEIFITHWHADHFAGLLGLLESMSLEDKKTPLRIFGPEAEKFVTMLLNLGYSTKKFSVIPKNVDFEGNQIQKLLETREFVINATPVKHGIPAVAYSFNEKDRVNIDRERAKKFGLPEKGLIYRKIKQDGKAVFKGREIKLTDISTIEKGKKIVYSGDTMPCSNMIKIAKDADLLIHDSTFFKNLGEGYRHATFDDVLSVAEKAIVKKIILTHISRRYQDIRELKELIKSHPNVKIARDFMNIVLK